MNSKTIINGIKNHPYIELNNKEKSLIFELSQQQHTIGRDRAHADLVVPEDWQVVGRCQAVLRKEGEDYRIIVKNGSQANSALPLLLIPQVIFSGVLFEMKGIGSKVSWLMLSRWSVGAYGTLVNINAMVPEAIKLPDGSTIARPFDPTPVYNATWKNLGLNWGILCLHAAIYWAMTLWLQKRKDIF